MSEFESDQTKVKKNESQCTGEQAYLTSEKMIGEFLFKSDRVNGLKSLHSSENVKVKFGEWLMKVVGMSVA